MDLKEACDILGLDYSKFIQTPEIEKGVSEVVDYKKLYEEQKSLNIEIIESISNIPTITNDKIGENFKGLLDKMDSIQELKKSVDSIQESISMMKDSPMHHAKSARLNVLEKSIDGSSNFNGKTYSLSNGVSIKALKKYLGNKTMESLEKGINNSIYEKAAMQLDANKTIVSEFRNILMKTDNIQIID